MKRLITMYLAVLVTSGLTHSAHAVDVAIVSSANDFVAGSNGYFDINVSGPDILKPAGALGSFDLTIGFDSGVVTETGVAVGDPTLGDQLDVLGLGSLISVTPGSGDVQIIEVSLDSPSDLLSLQANSFTLARVSFTALTAGSTAFSLMVNSVGDQLGNPLTSNVTSASITVSAVPELAARDLFLVGLGLVGLVTRRRKGTPIQIMKA